MSKTLSNSGRQREREEESGRGGVEKSLVDSRQRRERQKLAREALDQRGERKKSLKNLQGGIDNDKVRGRGGLSYLGVHLGSFVAEWCFQKNSKPVRKRDLILEISRGKDFFVIL